MDSETDADEPLSLSTRYWKLIEIKESLILRYAEAKESGLIPKDYRNANLDEAVSVLHDDDSGWMRIVLDSDVAAAASAEEWNGVHAKLINAAKLLWEAKRELVMKLRRV